jgi:hypothetical protein
MEVWVEQELEGCSFPDQRLKSRMGWEPRGHPANDSSILAAERVGRLWALPPLAVGKNPLASRLTRKGTSVHHSPS